MAKERSGRIIGDEQDTSSAIDIDNISCPVCGKVFDGLQELNIHLDDEHGFADDGSSSAPSTDTSSVNLVEMADPLISSRADGKRRVPVASTFKLNRSHWKKLIAGKTHCRACHRKLDQRNGPINCRKCGELFCLAHCRNAIKLNMNAEYDPLKGEWCKCCHDCFTNKPGYNDFGLFEDKTSVFLKIRDSKNEDHQLRVLQLENRLVRLLDGIILIYRQYKGSILSSLRISSEVSNLEQTVVAWQDDKSSLSCFICSKTFSVVLRKHHCRLCGRIVCGSEDTNCSNKIPTYNLLNAARDLPFKNTGPDVHDIDLDIRVCSHCIQSVFVKRKFQRDLKQALPIMLGKYESLYNTSRVILSLLPTFESTLQRLNENKQNPNKADVYELSKLRRKLLEIFSLYESLSKQISRIVPRNSSELRIQQSIALSSSSFIQEKMLPLKSLPSVLKPSMNNDTIPEAKKSSEIIFNNLTIKEVKEYREQLMVLNEQKYLVQEMINSATKQRKFDEISTLNENMAELQKQISILTEKLGDQGFH